MKDSEVDFNCILVLFYDIFPDFNFNYLINIEQMKDKRIFHSNLFALLALLKFVGYKVSVF